MSVFTKYLNKQLQEIRPYIPSPLPEEAQRASARADRPIIRLSSNENPLGASPKVVASIIENAKFVSLYPDSQAKKLRERISNWLNHGFQADNIVVGCGSSETFFFVIRAFTAPGDEVLYMDPSFLVYGEVALAEGRRPLELRLTEPDFESFRKLITRKTRVVFLTRPNNPTSKLIPLDLVRRISEYAQNSVVICDEAYVEFADGYPDISAINLIEEHNNIIVTRTFSKAFGIPDLRVGYAVGPRVAMQQLIKVKPKWNSGELSQKAAIAALDDEEHLKKHLKQSA